MHLLSQGFLTPTGDDSSPCDTEQGDGTKEFLSKAQACKGSKHPAFRLSQRALDQTYKSLLQAQAVAVDKYLSDPNLVPTT